MKRTENIDTITTERNARVHREQFKYDVPLQISDLKAAGASCAGCIHAMRKQFILHCSKKGDKIIQSYNICHRHQASLKL